MRTLLTIKNYRCFVEPATIELRNNMSAFVGVNNAGKSSLMRFVLEFRDLFGLIQHPGNLISAIHGLNAGFNLRHVADREEVFSNLIKHCEISFWFDFEYDSISEFPRPERVHFTVNRNLQWKVQITTTTESISLSPNNPNVFFRDNKLIVENQPKFDVSPLLKVAKLLFNSIYIGPFRNSINIGTNDNYLDIRVGQSFIRQFRVWKTGPVRQQNQAIIELTENIRRAFRFESLAIDASADDVSLHIAVNGRPYKQHELGSGLIQFIIVLANATIMEPSLILIDEPELNLHPSLQVDFLTLLGSVGCEALWYSTHSIGLARASSERIYSVIKRGDGDSYVRPLSGTPTMSEFLGEMSFSSYKELGFERILLVEGPTEVKAFQQIIRSMRKDHKILILPLNGRMLKADDLEEILRITTNVSALIDSERPSADASLDKDRQRFFELCQSRGLVCKILDRRATENYFPDSTIKSVFGPKYHALTDFQRLKDIEPHWSKDDNWKLAIAWPLTEVLKTDLGQFLAAL